MQAKGYEPSFDNDLKRGEVGENLLSLFFADGEDSNLFEVKTDYRSSETGNIYVETHKFRKYDRSDIVPSGITITKSKWWVQAAPDGEAMFIVKTEKLRRFIIYTNPTKAAQTISNSSTAGSLGVLVPVKRLMQFCKMLKAEV